MVGQFLPVHGPCDMYVSLKATKYNVGLAWESYSFSSIDIWIDGSKMQVLSEYTLHCKYLRGREILQCFWVKIVNEVAMFFQRTVLGSFGCSALATQLWPLSFVPLSFGLNFKHSCTSNFIIFLPIKTWYTLESRINFFSKGYVPY